VRDQVFQSIRERALLRAGDRVAVAVSGGADSVALLRVLLELRAELGIVLAVTHFNHGLRGEQSTADEAFVADLAKRLGLEIFVGRGDVREHASTFKVSIEAAGRELRYRWFAALAAEQRLNAIATAHTLDDQAETVLLKFLRGAGSKGLAGIYPVVELAGGAGAELPCSKRDLDGAPEGASLQSTAATEKCTIGAESKPVRNALGADLKPNSTPAPQRCKVIRPLLCVSRQQVEDYLTTLGQSWREDESNLDRRFLRNRVRHELLPLLEREFNPNVRQAMTDAAEIARAEQEFWQQLTEQEFLARLQEDPRKVSEDQGAEATSPDRLDLEGFAQLPLALQRRLLKRFAERQPVALDFEHIERMRCCALGELLKTELSGGRVAERVGRALLLHLPSAPQAQISYQYVLPVPGEIHIGELNLIVRAEPVPDQFAQEVAGGELMSLDLLGTELTVRNWHPGDRFWPAFSGSVEKLKRLFAEKRIPAADRSGWPVVLSGDQIVWVRGFPVANRYQWKGRGAAVRIATISVQE
jgi:tRNA(Ile)-lysidine synthase